LRADIDYLEHRTVWSDFRILVSTAMYVLRAVARH
jgi:lipopolysaccharide/colanic/teichoic acid biosynthesis glycosyltransferase